MPLQMHLVGVVELDPRTIQLTVIERWSERRLFRTVEHEQQRSYTLSIGVGRWHNGERFVLRDDPRHFRLFELWQESRLGRRLDAFLFDPEPVTYALPAVPGLPRMFRSPVVSS